LNCKWFK